MLQKLSLHHLVALLLSAVLALSCNLPVNAEEEGDGAGSMVVRAIAVEGNVEVDTETILQVIQATKIGEPVDAEKVQMDVNRIAELGYFESVEAQPYPYQDGLRILFHVSEFPVVRTIDVVVKEGVVSPEQVKPLLGVKEGEVLNARILGEALDRIATSDTYGYVLRPTAVGFSGEAGDVLYVELAPVRVGEILIEGREKTQENVIRRELTFDSGEILSMEAIRVSLNKLGQLGYFEPIIPEFLTTDDPLVIDVLLPVTELKTGRAAFGGGYSSADGLLGYIEISDRNFLGRGEHVNVRWQFGQKTNTYDLGFMEPYLFGTKTTAGIQLYNRVSLREEFADGKVYPYEEKRVGGDFTLGRPLGNYTRGFLTLRMENHSIRPEDEATSVVEPEDARTRSVIANVRTDTTDHLYYPTTGVRYDFSAEMAGAFLGGDSRFTKYTASASKFVKVGRNNQTLAFRVMTGIGAGEIPFAEEFRIGGAETVRGYRYGQMRGDRMLVAQAEYRFPISQTIHGVLFVDAGNAWKGGSVNLGDLKAGAGVGIRFNTPLGVIRLDYGIAEGRGQAYFSLGPSF